MKESRKKRSDGKTPAQRTAQAKKAWDTMRKKKAGEDSERGCGINPILDIILKNKKVKSTRQDKQYEEQVEKWRKLLAEKDPWIEEEKFVELFEMYDFVASKPPQEVFFSFKISPRLAHGESKQDIVVILIKLTGKIIEQYIEGLTSKLQNQKAVIITIVKENTNPLDFSYDTDKICLIDKYLLECLLYYRIDVIKRYALYHDIMEKKKI